MAKSNCKDIECVNCLTADCFIKKYCSAEYLASMNEMKNISFYKDNQYVAYEGNSVMGLFFIQSGRVKIVSAGLDGKQHLVRLSKQGGLIGHRGYGGDRYPISAITLEESTICFFDNDTIHKAFMDNPELTFELMMYYSKELRKSEAKIKSQAQMNVREKVADALLSCDSMFNDAQEYPFQLPLTRSDLAGFSGINTEQLSRVLSEFKKDETITILKNKISIINTENLQELIAPFGMTE